MNNFDLHSTRMINWVLYFFHFVLQLSRIFSEFASTEDFSSLKGRGGRHPQMMSAKIGGSSAEPPPPSRPTPSRSIPSSSLLTNSPPTLSLPLHLSHFYPSPTPTPKCWRHLWMNPERIWAKIYNQRRGFGDIKRGYRSITLGWENRKDVILSSASYSKMSRATNELGNSICRWPALKISLHSYEYFYQ